MGKQRRKELQELRRAEARELQERQARFVAAQLSYWSGPTPSPDVLREYNEIVPGSAERIIAMAERQAEHRQNLETMAVKGGTGRAYLGSVFGFIIGMTAVLGGLYLAVNGQELGGYAVMLGTVATLAGVFVYGRKSAQREITKKNPGQELARIGP